MHIHLKGTFSWVRCVLRREEGNTLLGPGGETGSRFFKVTNCDLKGPDADLAELYGVSTKRLNEAVRRNATRFPEDFMFRLSAKEYISLMSQIATSKPGRGGRRKLPYAFTEQGVAMLSSVLNSDQAIQVNITIMRAFVRIRRLLVSHEELARKVEALEGKYDSKFRVVFDAIRALMEPPKTPRRRIGF
jgi:hypothetical protein